VKSVKKPRPNVMQLLKKDLQDGLKRDCAEWAKVGLCELDYRGTVRVGLKRDCEGILMIDFEGRTKEGLRED
jgi:hypothetical protein